MAKTDWSKVVWKVGPPSYAEVCAHVEHHGYGPDRGGDWLFFGGTKMCGRVSLRGAGNDRIEWWTRTTSATNPDVISGWATLESLVDQCTKCVPIDVHGELAG